MKAPLAVAVCLLAACLLAAADRPTFHVVDFSQIDPDSPSPISCSAEYTCVLDPSLPGPSNNHRPNEMLEQAQTARRKRSIPGQVAIVTGPLWGWENYIPAIKTTMENSLNLAFGTGNWQRFLFTDTASTYLNSDGRSAVLVFIGDSQDSQGATYLTTNRAALESFVNDGGAVMVAISHNGGAITTTLPFGWNFTNSFGSSTANILSSTHNLVEGGDYGDPWQTVTGCSFAHGYLTTADANAKPALVSGNDVSKVLYYEATKGLGYFAAFALTSPYFVSRPGISCGNDLTWSAGIFADIWTYVATSASQAHVGTRSTTASCQGHCGGPSSLCWCDSACSSYGDCCPDFITECTVPNALAQAIPNGCFASLKPNDVDAIIKGATLLSSGGGGAYADATVLEGYIRDEFSNGKNLRLYTPNRDCNWMPYACVLAMMGNPETYHEWLQNPATGNSSQKEDWHNKAYAGVLNQMDVYQNSMCTGIMPIETGGMNTIAPLYAAITTGRMLLDVDGGGRSVPFLQQTFWAANPYLQAKTTPLATAAVWNLSVPIFEPGDGYLQQDILYFPRGASQGTYNASLDNTLAFMGVGSPSLFQNVATISMYPMAWSNATKGYTGAISRALSVGNAINTGSIAYVKGNSSGCIIGAAGAGYTNAYVRAVYSWTGGDHQWQLTEAVTSTGKLIQMLAFNENAALYVSNLAWTSPPNCVAYGNPPSPSQLPLAANLVAQGPDAFSWLQLDPNPSPVGGYTLRPLSCPDIYSKCQGSQLLVHNMLFTVQSMWGAAAQNTICNPPPTGPSVCYTQNIPVAYQCFCTQALNWNTVYDGFNAIVTNTSSTKLPYYVSYAKLAAAQCA